MNISLLKYCKHEIRKSGRFGNAIKRLFMAKKYDLFNVIKEEQEKAWNQRYEEPGQLTD